MYLCFVQALPVYGTFSNSLILDARSFTLKVTFKIRNRYAVICLVIHYGRSMLELFLDCWLTICNFVKILIRPETISIKFRSDQRPIIVNHCTISGATMQTILESISFDLYSTGAILDLCGNPLVDLPGQPVTMQRTLLMLAIPWLVQ